MKKQAIQLLTNRAGLKFIELPVQVRQVQGFGVRHFCLPNAGQILTKTSSLVFSKYKILEIGYVLDGIGRGWSLAGRVHHLSQSKPHIVEHSLIDRLGLVTFSCALHISLFVE
jgi:hypothetical protein